MHDGAKWAGAEPHPRVTGTRPSLGHDEYNEGVRALVVSMVAACATEPPRPDGIIVASDHHPVQLATDDNFLYWSEFRGGIFKTPLDATNADAIEIVGATVTPQPNALVVDGSAIYWSDAGTSPSVPGSLLKASLDGTAVTVLVPDLAGIPAFRLAANQARLFWTSSDGVWAVDKVGGSSQRVASAEQGAEEIAVDATSAYWTNPSMHTIRGLDLTVSTAVPTTFATASGFHIATDSTNVYWLAFDSSRYATLMMAPIGGGDPVVLDRRLSPEGDVSGGLGTDGRSVYWSSDSAIMRIDVDGTGFATLANHNQQINSTAIGPTSVYWGAAQMIDGPNGSQATTGIRRADK